ncbi:hypothetical protein CRE_10804 [Caenorhabditis remanei]|uniref:F-box associated domain-containing protein n=1 Tax=Caenorhabditis remanei TaxID=31234 RepID=E3M4Y8_CAERE|nr:hypothetical protein CRE_10804 [Caenorhabditis remanei]
MKIASDQKTFPILKLPFLFIMEFRLFGNIYKYLKRNTALTHYKTERNTICIEFTKEWADYTLAFFRKDLSCLAMNSNLSTHEILSITDWLNKKQWTLEYCEFSGDDTNPESIDLFFEKRKVAIGNLSFVLRPEHKIRPLKLGVLDVDEFFVKTDLLNILLIG